MIILHWFPQLKAPSYGRKVRAYVKANPTFLNEWKHLVDNEKFIVVCLLTGSIARSAKRQLFSLLRGRFWGFLPRRGDTMHRWGWNLARRRGPRGRETEGPLLRANFHPHRCNDKGIGPQKLKFYWYLIKMWNINIPCAIFTKFAESVPRFKMR